MGSKGGLGTTVVGLKAARHDHNIVSTFCASTLVVVMLELGRQVHPISCRRQIRTGPARLGGQQLPLPEVNRSRISSDELPSVTLSGPEHW